MYLLFLILISNVALTLSEHKNIYGRTFDKIRIDVQLATYNSPIDIDKPQSLFADIAKIGQEDVEEILVGNVLADKTLEDGVSGKVLTEAVNHECLSRLFLMYEHKNETWVKAMVDALGKPGSGVLDGNVFWVGDYDECVSIQATVRNHSQTTDISARYCLANIEVKGFPTPIKWGVCLPSECHAEDVKNGLNSVIQLVPKVRKSVFVTTVKCDADSIPMTTGAIICM